jgi:type VI secretion system secreted protein Hcp
MVITAEKQGKFQGEGTGDRKSSIPILAFTMELNAPTDPATGRASGKRQYQPITIIKTWGAASPQALTAVSTNETLTTVSFQFFNTDVAGREVAFQNVNLTNAHLRNVRRYIGDPKTAQGLAPSASGATGLEQWSFVFEKIDVEDIAGKTAFIDSWVATA